MKQKQNQGHREQTGSCQRVGGWRKDGAEGWQMVADMQVRDSKMANGF